MVPKGAGYLVFCGRVGLYAKYQAALTLSPCSLNLYKPGEKLTRDEQQYHFAALARPDLGGKANHVDEAALVAHDMGAIGSFPGLVRTADAMHGAWARFIATGDPNPTHINGSQPTTMTTSSSATTPFWPRFSSPFVGDTASSPGRLRRKGRPGGRAKQDEECGRVMMFGLGNDERMGAAGRGTPGVPATVVRMTDREVEACRFWWERVELSEGMGTRLGRVPARSRL